MERLLNVPMILASTSPRRIELLQQMNFQFEVVPPSSDEKRLPGEAPRAMVRRLAIDKAQSVTTRVMASTGGGLIIAADTIVVAPNGKTVLGKPENVAEAAKMLKMLAGRTHTVFTGYCVLAVARGMDTERVVRVVMSRVKMRSLSARDISQYIKTGEPMDKAGSYAAQGVGMALIEGITGSYTNVVGLPMCQLLLDLEKKFSITPWDG